MISPGNLPGAEAHPADGNCLTRTASRNDAGTRQTHPKAGRARRDPQKKRAALHPTPPTLVEPVETPNASAPPVPFIMDVYGSMRDPVPNLGMSKLELGQQGAGQALE
ncbi:MAG: hypothetical protein ACOYEV_11325, partial [Candidatus Nanopelagicales bacterium]